MAQEKGAGIAPEAANETTWAICGSWRQTFLLTNVGFTGLTLRFSRSPKAPAELKWLAACGYKKTASAQFKTGHLRYCARSETS